MQLQKYFEPLSEMQRERRKELEGFDSLPFQVSPSQGAAKFLMTMSLNVVIRDSGTYSIEKTQSPV